MKQIWKFTLNEKAEKEIEMPVGSKILTAQMQSGTLTIWAIVNPENQKEIRKIEIVGTGWDMDFTGKEYIATVQDGSFVWHVFEIVKK